MKLTYGDKLMLHTALMEDLERRIGDPSQPDEQLPESVLEYVNRRYGNHGLSFRSIKHDAVHINCMRAKEILRALSDEPCEQHSPTIEDLAQALDNYARKEQPT